MKNKIYGKYYKDLNVELMFRRGSGQTIVMASGTFDLLHYGHVKLLYAAKAKGDVLVVAVKSDKAASLKRGKLPIMNEAERMEAVASLDCVDYVVLADYEENIEMTADFDNESANQWYNMYYSIVQTLHPDIFVHEDNPLLKEARKLLFTTYGIKGEINPRTEGISSSEIIRRVRQRIMEEELGKKM